MLVQLPQHKIAFPAPETALAEPNGLLAIGGDLSTERLLSAYQHGIFPWFGPDDPILWWSPNPRAVFHPAQLHISRSMRKFMRKTTLRVSLNKNFRQVIRQCAAVREHHEGTWISPQMAAAYSRLFEHGHAHSVEVWEGNQLVGGLYGVALGQMFCGESMFQTVDNASKLALFAFAQHFAAAGGQLIDCQVGNAHLFSLGAKPMSRELFLHKLHILQHKPVAETMWQPRELSLVGSGSDGVFL